MPSTLSTTETSSSRSAARATPALRRTARSAPTPRPSPPGSPAARTRSRRPNTPRKLHPRRFARVCATSARALVPWLCWGPGTDCHKIGPLVKLLRMKPGFGEVLLAEGDPKIREQEDLLIQEFRRQLDEGMWAAVPTTDPGSGRREAVMVQDYAEVPREAERVIFFPRAAGG